MMAILIYYCFEISLFSLVQQIHALFGILTINVTLPTLDVWKFKAKKIFFDYLEKEYIFDIQTTYLLLETCDSPLIYELASKISS